MSRLCMNPLCGSTVRRCHGRVSHVRPTVEINKQTVGGARGCVMRMYRCRRGVVSRFGPNKKRDRRRSNIGSTRTRPFRPADPSVCTRA